MKSKNNFAQKGIFLLPEAETVLHEVRREFAKEFSMLPDVHMIGREIISTLNVENNNSAINVDVNKLINFILNSFVAKPKRGGRHLPLELSDDHYAKLLEASQHLYKKYQKHLPDRPSAQVILNGVICASTIDTSVLAENIRRRYSTQKESFSGAAETQPPKSPPPPPKIAESVYPM